jgi:hypothetical protein
LSFDKLRWALEKNPSRIHEYIERARTALRLNLGKTATPTPRR